MSWTCFFKGRSWPDWKPWWHDAPRIVFASIEYLNDTRHVRKCARCGKFEARHRHKIRDELRRQGAWPYSSKDAA